MKSYRGEMLGMNASGEDSTPSARASGGMFCLSDETHIERAAQWIADANWTLIASGAGQRVQLSNLRLDVECGSPIWPQSIETGIARIEFIK